MSHICVHDPALMKRSSQIIRVWNRLLIGLIRARDARREGGSSVRTPEENSLLLTNKSFLSFLK